MNLAEVTGKNPEYEIYVECIKIISMTKTIHGSRVTSIFEYKGITYLATIDLDTEEVTIQGYGNLPICASFSKALVDLVIAKYVEYKLTK